MNWSVCTPFGPPAAQSLYRQHMGFSFEHVWFHRDGDTLLARAFVARKQVEGKSMRSTVPEALHASHAPPSAYRRRSKRQAEVASSRSSSGATCFGGRVGLTEERRADGVR